MPPTVLATVFNGAQVGVQSVFDTGVAANKKLLGLGMSRIMPRVAGGAEMFTGQGDKLPTQHTSFGGQHSEFDFSSLLSFNISCYPFASIINNSTPSADGTNGKKWEFSTALNAANAKALYTVEIGNATRAKRAINVSGQSLQLDMAKTVAPKMSGKLIGGKREDDVTITGSPQIITPVLVQPGNWNCKVANTQAALDAASVFALPIRATFNIPDVAGILYRMVSADTSFIARPERAIMPTLKFTGGDFDDDYADFIDALEDGSTRWFRFTNLGPVIAGAVPSQYKFELDYCGALTEPETPTEEEGAATNDWNFNNQYDGDAGFSFRITCINAMAAL
jgi:hypothetical protein